MKQQHGQSMVEFALIAPMIFLMIFGMIWGGYMFMEYLRFSNDVRAAARAVALVSDPNKREELGETYKNTLKEMYKKELPTLYEPDIQINPAVKYDELGNKSNDEDVVITVTFTRRNDLPAVLMWVNFPPDKIPALNYHMRLEGFKTTDSTTENG